MERLLMDIFIHEENINITDPAALLNMVQSCNRENLNETLSDQSTVTLIDKYRSFEEKVLKAEQTC